jgi:GAF domain-containing protein
MADVTRAAMAGADATELLERVAATIRSELLFQTVAVNLLDPARRELRVVAVLGDDDARARLLGTSSPWSAWERLLTGAAERRGAFWLPAGSHEISRDITTWTPLVAAALGPDRWHPDDLLVLPLRDAAGEIVGLVSVDEPRSGVRPSDADLDMLMALADHAALALEQARRRVAPAVAV